MAKETEVGEAMPLGEGLKKLLAVMDELADGDIAVWGDGDGRIRLGGMTESQPGREMVYAETSVAPSSDYVHPELHRSEVVTAPIGLPTGRIDVEWLQEQQDRGRGRSRDR